MKQLEFKDEGNYHSLMLTADDKIPAKNKMYRLGELNKKTFTKSEAIAFAKKNKMTAVFEFD